MDDHSGGGPRGPTPDDDPFRSADQAAVQRRLDAEEDERLAALDALRSQDLVAVSNGLWARACRVQLGVGGRRFTGRIAAVGADWLALETAGGEVDVRLPACAWLRELRDAAGRSPRATPESVAASARTFRARLAQLELSRARVDIGADGGRFELAGRILAAARDHVVVADPGGEVWHVARIDWVALRRS